MDITDRVLLEQRLVQDEKLKTLGAIAAEVAHEIRNPLVSIGGFARRLQKSAPDLAEADIILREAGRLEQLLDRINNYLTPVNLRRERCQANSVLADAVEFLSPRIDERGIWPDLRLAQDLPEVFADAEVLRQIFVNTILNAIKTSRTQGVFTIRTLLRGDNVHAEFVTELPQGAEVDPDKLLAPFSEADEHIGLSLSHRLIKHMGGLLTVEHEEGVATFRIILPRKDRLEELEGEPAEDVELETVSAQPAVKNPAEFHELYQVEWQRQAREVRPLSLALVGLDHFDAYRRRHGELAARRLLELAGDALAGRLRRPGDFVALYADGCFAAVLPGAPQEGAATVGWSLVESVGDLCVAAGIESGLRNMTASVGVATCVPQNDLSPEDLLSEAAQALKQAQSRGMAQLVSASLAP
jgi:diguanylate cyclase (GGDEF)-like protein